MSTSAFHRPTTSPPPIHEPSAWLRGAVARRLAVIDQLTDLPEHDDILIGPLGRAGTPGSREDRTCDRCRQYTPPGGKFHPLPVHPRPDVLLVGGLCARCARKEGIR